MTALCPTEAELVVVTMGTGQLHLEYVRPGQTHPTLVDYTQISQQIASVFNQVGGCRWQNKNSHVIVNISYRTFKLTASVHEGTRVIRVQYGLSFSSVCGCELAANIANSRCQCSVFRQFVSEGHHLQLNQIRLYSTGQLYSRQF